MRSDYLRNVWAIFFFLSGAAAAFSAEPLPSWNDSSAKRAIVDFVGKVSNSGSPDYVAEAQRIAVFDNDGTLWAEQPMYAQLAFALDRVKALAPGHPEWSEQEPFASILKGDFKSVLKGGEKNVFELIMATHAGMTSDEFEKIVADWLASAKNPRTGRLYTEMVYQPMVELLGYLRGNGFKTFIVSGGGAEFMRPWVEKAYGIPPEQVIGSTIKTKYEMRGGQPLVIRLPDLGFYDDKEGKPIGIHEHIGRRPILAVGNSDGDLAMLQWTCDREGPHLCAFIHHTDGDREWSYDRSSAIGKLDKGLDESAAKGWTLVDMKSDWARIFAFEK